MDHGTNLLARDVVVVLKLLVDGNKSWTYSTLGKEVGVSASQAYVSVARAANSHLLHFAGLPANMNRANLKEFLIHGVKYAFPAYRGTVTRGIPTSYAAPPLDQVISQPLTEPPPVWPFAGGTVRGVELSPLYKTVPEAALRDRKLYELLALVDAIRAGRARERDIAIRELTARLDAKE